MDLDELKSFIVDVIQEEITPCPTPIAKRWEGGTLNMVPVGDTQAKEIPLEVFFKKIVGVRDALRVLEQKVNSSNLSQTEKANLHSYITKSYGSLTTFNILFKEDKDKFVGAGKQTTKKGDMSVLQAKKKLGLNEY